MPRSEPDPPDWTTCEHQWGEAVRVADVDFGVTFGSFDITFGYTKKCIRCGAVHYDDWTAERSGIVERIYPPSTQ